MTITDQLKIIDDIIKANQAQYDLDRFAAKISAYSSEAKFEYSPLGNIFTEGLDKDDQKEGFFKRLENTKNKTVELLKAFSAANKDSKAAKMRVILIMTLTMLFPNFTEVLKYLKECH